MKRFAVGIDLGTTNTVVAYAEFGSNEIRLFDIEQLVAPGEVKAASLLPSLRFHPAPGELAAGDLQLPWTSTEAAEPEPVVIGTLARKLGAQVPGRLVASAKSWLSHAAVDRLAPILPWGASADVLKVSPVDASASYLAHVRAAWNWRLPECPLEQQDVVLTIPASFDEGARALTVQAAHQAGLPQLRLLEEPQAAFYDWLFRHRDSLAAELEQTRLILVCDVGGGTTDLSLIKVEMQDGQPQLTRIGVGKHLMLGGDNMDLVLAHLIEARMNDGVQDGAAKRLSATSLSQLLERCRTAKEQLLAAGAPDKTLVTLLGSGSRLIGGARSIEMTREEVERTIVDGFFPMAAPTELARLRRSGIVEFGLPYASDPAITRHLAGFLNQHAAAARDALGLLAPDEGTPAVPDTLLLNGGVFRAPVLARRLEGTLAAWRGKPLQLLHNENPDVAVARGAVAYTLAREGLAPKIGGGSARSYFLVIDDRAKGAGQHVVEFGRGICVLPRGSEQGKEILLHDRAFALRLGQPVRFHLVSSTADEGNRPRRLGELVDLNKGDFAHLPPIATVLQSDTVAGKQEIPVQLATSLTEVGTLEMHCVSTTDASRRWLLEFQLHDEGLESAAAEESENAQKLPPHFTDAVEKIDRIFGTRAQKVEAKEVRQLRAQLEKLIGGREHWHTPLLRQLFDELWQRARGRRRSADHEKVWLNLIGYCLRPGFGYPLDDWRIQQLWPLFETGIQHRNDSQVAKEWWTMWRRVAGGLDKDAQLRLLDDFAFNVQDDKAELQRRPINLVKGSYDDMLRLAASLERIPASYKVEIGDWLLGLLNKTSTTRDPDPPDSLILWALARIGTRQPFYASAHDVVPPDIVAGWLDTIMALDWKRVDAAPFTAAHLARLTGDRTRDLPDELRDRLVSRLEAIGAAPTWITMLRQTVQLDEASQRNFLGDSLPPGLKLIG
ncbi:MAG: molecular chaperone DnaK [Burkholderiales bacterium RIFCSPLOWO2_02_FULL_57_36]|nr:MAG: molecular chaperone DnaK [Burkholderiales bacterium RIFCSPLOWO2_02_FULL_57_36]